ncbi:phage virion morphogenesis protein [Methylomonas sp. 11b]|uniref:phage virion morphogenesis protein n=1 Tax=Methylomonas sp. 11b TaxID=1168169 RepID=UPI000479B32C|nr:phage virion morphogenesis protein [Methylomonas sp. 11b]
MGAFIEWDDREVLKAFQKLEAKTGNLRPAFLEIGEELTESTKDRFVKGVGPDGQRWQDNSAVTIEQKGRNKPLVGESGKLMDETNYQLFGNDAVFIGSPMEYAAMQHFGGTKSEFPWLWGDIVARPIYGISDSDEAMILAILDNHFTL